MMTAVGKIAAVKTVVVKAAAPAVGRISVSLISVSSAVDISGVRIWERNVGIILLDNPGNILK